MNRSGDQEVKCKSADKFSDLISDYKTAPLPLKMCFVIHTRLTEL